MSWDTPQHPYHLAVHTVPPPIRPACLLTGHPLPRCWPHQHHYLSHLDDIKARRAARGGIAHLRKHHRHQHHHHHHHAAAHGDADDSSSGSSDDEDGDDEAYSKLAILTANSHYLARL